MPIAPDGLFASGMGGNVLVGVDVGALASLVIGLPTLCDRDLEVAPDHVPLQPPDRSDLEESDSWQINLDRIGCHAGLSASANKVLPGPDGSWTAVTSLAEGIHYTLSVLWPVIFMTTERETSARSMLRTADRLRS